MTFKDLSKIIKDNNVPDNVILRSDSGWECDDTEMNGVWYNKKKNTIIFTQDSILIKEKMKGDTENWKCLSTNYKFKNTESPYDYDKYYAYQRHLLGTDKELTEAEKNLKSAVFGMPNYKELW